MNYRVETLATPIVMGQNADLYGWRILNAEGSTIAYANDEDMAETMTDNLNGSLKSIAEIVSPETEHPLLRSGDQFLFKLMHLGNPDLEVRFSQYREMMLARFGNPLLTNGDNATTGVTP